MTVSTVTKPGMMSSGSVTFTDRVTCEWDIDEDGRPLLVPPHDGYEPPESDMPTFGKELQAKLRGTMTNKPKPEKPGLLQRLFGF